MYVSLRCIVACMRSERVFVVFHFSSGGMYVVGKTTTVGLLGFHQMEISQVYFTKGECFIP